MRDVLDDLRRLVAGRRDRRRGHRRRHLAVGAPPAGRVDAGRPGRHRGRQRVRRLRRGRGLRAGRATSRDDGAPVLQRYGVSDDDAFAVGLTCGGIIDVFVEPVDRETLPRARRRRRRHRGRPAGRGRHRDQRRRADRLGRRLVVAARRRSSGSLGSDAARRRRRATTPAGCSPQGRTGIAALRPGRRAARRRPRGVRRVLRAAAADDRVRRDRLRRGGRPGRRVPRLPGHGLRRPAGVRHREAVPRRRRGRRRLAAPLPRPSEPDGRRAHRALRAHPRPEVRRAAARGRAARCRWPTSARWARGARTTTGWPGCARPA